MTMNDDKTQDQEHIITILGQQNYELCQELERVRTAARIWLIGDVLALIVIAILFMVIVA